MRGRDCETCSLKKMWGRGIRNGEIASHVQKNFEKKCRGGVQHLQKIVGKGGREKNNKNGTALIDPSTRYYHFSKSIYGIMSKCNVAISLLNHELVIFFVRKNI